MLLQLFAAPRLGCALFATDPPGRKTPRQNPGFLSVYRAGASVLVAAGVVVEEALLLAGLATVSLKAPALL